MERQLHGGFDAMQQPKPSLGSMLGPGADGGIVGWCDNERLLSEPPPPPPKLEIVPAVSASYPPVQLTAVRRILGVGDRRRHFGVMASVGALLLILVGWAQGDDTPASAEAVGLAEVRGLDVALASQRVAAGIALKKDEKKDEKKLAKADDDSPTDQKPSTSSDVAPRPEAKHASDKGEAKSAFDRDAVRNAVFGAAGSASACRVKGGPTGRAKATVTIAPSGRVVSVAVGGPFGGSKVGNCISRVFKSVRVPPFEGSAVTVSKTVTIR